MVLRNSERCKLDVLTFSVALESATLGESPGYRQLSSRPSPVCDVAASELMFPSPWFTDRVSVLPVDASELATLTDDYQASRESTVRRFVELHRDPMAAVFFSWKLKPTQQRHVKAKSKTKPLFPGMEESGPAPMLRVDYRITNDEFAEHCTDYIPDDKSIPSEGPIFEASQTQAPQDGEQQLDFGRSNRRFAVSALPIFTTEDAVGPDGGCSVVAVLRPLH